MNNQRLLARIEKIEAILAPQGMAAEAPIDVSETLTLIASIRHDTIRLSELDQKRWYCPDDPRSIFTDEEQEEESETKARVLEKCAVLGFPGGYGQRQYRKDGHRLRLLSEKEKSTSFIRFSASEQAEVVIIRARREFIYEAGPKHRAYLREQEIVNCDDDSLWSQVTLCEQHEIDHLHVLHPDESFGEEELASMDRRMRVFAEHGQRLKRMFEKEPRSPGPKERLDEWHSRKGEDPRYFKTISTCSQFPSNPYVLERQNKQLVEMGFRAIPPLVYHPTKEEYDAERLAIREKRFDDYIELSWRRRNRGSTKKEVAE